MIMKHYQDLFVTCKCFTIVPCLGARKLWRPKACGICSCHAKHAEFCEPDGVL